MNELIKNHFVTVCDMIEDNVAAIFGPNNAKTSGNVNS